MLIDWFTVIAQVLNFLVLVWLMKRFLYTPILSAIDARERGIAAQLADATAKEAESQKEHDEFRQKSADFDRQRADLLHKAAEDAGAERERLLAAARKDVDAQRSGWQEALRSEQHDLGDELARRTRRGVFDIARKALAGLATADLETQMCDAFVARLRALNGAENAGFAAALTLSPQPALLRSAFDLPPARRQAIEAAVDEKFAGHAPLRFETAPDLVGGIELTTDGQKVAWSIADYLATLEKDVGALMEEKAKPEADAKPEAKSAAVESAAAVPSARLAAR